MKYNNHLGRLKMLMEAQQAQSEMQFNRDRLKLAEDKLNLDAKEFEFTQKAESERRNIAAQMNKAEIERQRQQDELTANYRKEMLEKNQFTDRFNAIDQLTKQYGNWESVPEEKKYAATGYRPPSKTGTGQKPQSWQVGLFAKEWDDFLEQGNDLLALKGKWPGGKEGATFRNVDEGLNSDEDVFDWIRELRSKVVQTRQFPDPSLSFKVQGQLRKLKTDGDLWDRIKAMEDGSLEQTASAAIYDEIMGAFSLDPIRGQVPKETLRQHLEAARKKEQEAEKSKTFWERAGSNLQKSVTSPNRYVAPPFSMSGP
jgi:hypothetical protein